MTQRNYTPCPVFNTLEEVTALYKETHAATQPTQVLADWLAHCFAHTKQTLPDFAAKDFLYALRFIYSYRGSKDTFGAYRRELERLLQWCWFVRNKSVLTLNRDDIEAFIEFCIKPPKRWIGLKTVARFKLIQGQPEANLDWRPFTVHVSKKDRKSGAAPDKKDYQLSQQALKVMFGILSSFYKFLLQEDLTTTNPVALIRQKSKFIRKEAQAPTVRRLSDTQWQMVIKRAKKQALYDFREERTVFMLSCLYSMYLRISELVANDRWMPTMGDFSKDNEGNWWFQTVGKGNKARQIAVSDAMLQALERYRTTFLNQPPQPTPGENLPLICHLHNHQKPLRSTRPIRTLLQKCFDQAAEDLEREGDQHEADLLRAATVHWLRHTGISEDVKHRPREHVRDDAGHSSSAITDRYIDVELKERARSAKDKPI